MPRRLCSLDDLNLSVRARNCLRKINIDSVEKLVLLTGEEILRLKSMGSKSLNEIKGALEKYGLGLGMKPGTLCEIETDDMTVSCQPAISQRLDILYYNANVQDFDFSVRSQNFFKSLGITKIHEVTKLSKKEIMSAPNAGRKTVQEIEEKLNSKGMFLEMDLSAFDESLEQRLKEQFSTVPSSDLIDLDLRHFLAFSYWSGTGNEFAKMSVDIEKYFSLENLDLVILELVNQFFETLDGREEVVAKSRIFSLEAPSTLEEIGKNFGITRERIRQIETKLCNKLVRICSVGVPFMKESIERSTKQGIDPFERLTNSMRLFGAKSSFLDFLKLVGVSLESISELSIPDSLPSSNQIRNDLLINYIMPMTSSQLEEILMRDYGLNSIQVQDFLNQELKGVTIRGDGLLLIEAPTKYLAVANVSLGYPNGIPWKDLARISKANFKKCEYIKTSLSPDYSITDNPYLYNYGRGNYRHRKFYDISVDLETEIEQKVFLYVQQMNELVKPLLAIKDELNIPINIYDLLHLLNDRSTRFNIDTKSGKMAVIKSSNGNALGYCLKSVVKDCFKSKNIPLTTFEIKEFLNSKSEGHASLIISLLIEDGDLIRFDGARYALVENLDQEIVGIVKNEIHLLIKSTEKICAGAYFKKKIEEKYEFRFTRFFYSSIAKIVCKEHGFYWRRHFSSKLMLDEKLSIYSYALDAFPFDSDPSFEEFSQIIRGKFEIDNELLHDEFYRFKSRLRRNTETA